MPIVFLSNLKKHSTSSVDDARGCSGGSREWMRKRLATEVSSAVGMQVFQTNYKRGNEFLRKRLATEVSSAVGMQVFQTNYKRGNEFLHRLIKFAMCTGRKNRLRHYNLRTGE